MDSDGPRLDTCSRMARDRVQTVAGGGERFLGRLLPIWTVGEL